MSEVLSFNESYRTPARPVHPNHSPQSTVRHLALRLRKPDHRPFFLRGGLAHNDTCLATWLAHLSFIRRGRPRQILKATHEILNEAEAEKVFLKGV